MKLILFSIILSSGLNLNIDKTSFDNISDLDRDEQSKSTIVFLKPMSGTIKILEKVNFSFYVDQSIISEYRYKIEVPKGLTDVVTDGLSTWSGWKSDYSINIRTQTFSRAGKFKFIVEYKLFTSNQTKLFEKPFEVKGENPGANNVTATILETKPSNTIPQGESKKSQTLVKEPIVITKPTTIEKVIVASQDTATILPKNAEIFSKDEKPGTDLVKPPIEIPKSEPKVDISEIRKDYNKLLLESVSEKNAELFRSCIEMGANTDITDDNGGNIFHLMAGKIEDENLIPVLINKGISINKKDSYGNTPLHYAILTGEYEYARSLIRQGADINIKNQQDLTPLHLSAFFNNEESVKELLKKGADINISGNAGYMALHIAAELNNLAIAKDLLIGGAKTKITTGQNLSPKTIAKIQRNQEMGKLIKSNGSYSFSSVNTVESQNYGQAGTKSYPKIDFNLAYDQDLVRKRHFNEIIQWVSIPVFVASAAGAVFFHTQANGYFSDYKNAETEDVAHSFYNRTRNYDTYALISATVSVGSVYSFIHSTFRKKNISGKMRKTF